MAVVAGLASHEINLFELNGSAENAGPSTSVVPATEVIYVYETSRRTMVVPKRYGSVVR